jgi:hypothetical protein
VGLPPGDASRFVLGTAALSILGYEHGPEDPAIRLWNDDGHAVPPGRGRVGAAAAVTGDDRPSLGKTSSHDIWRAEPRSADKPQSFGPQQVQTAARPHRL